MRDVTIQDIFEHIDMDNENVSFYAKDYRDVVKYKPMTLSGEGFLSRFLLHVLPMLIRYFSYEVFCFQRY